MKIEIEEKYLMQSNVLDYKHSKSYFPIIPAFVKIPETNSSTYPFTENFIFDSGASISVIHQRQQDLFKNIDPYATTPLTFGNSKAKLNVYKIGIQIQGFDIPILAALANDLQINYSLLGYFGGYEKFDFIGLSIKSKTFKLKSKYGI